MSNFSKASIPVAELPVKERNLKSRTVFTNNFFHLTPVYRRKLYVGDSLDYHGERFSRTLPMPYPAFSAVNDVYRAFYVPYKSVFRGIDDVMNNTLHIAANGQAGVVDQVMNMLAVDLTTAFISNSNFLASNGTSTDHDFVIRNTANVLAYYKFTARGAQVYKCLNGLGYELATDQMHGQKVLYNALPLMCYVRVILDWYFPKTMLLTVFIPLHFLFLIVIPILFV